MRFARAIQVLSRRTKNNPAPHRRTGGGEDRDRGGCAIVEGDVRQSLARKRLIVLDLGSLVAGARSVVNSQEREGGQRDH